MAKGLFLNSDPTDSTSLTLLGKVGLSPDDGVAWGRFIGIYGPQISSWSKRWGLQEADVEDVTQNVLLCLAQKLRTFNYDSSRSFRGWLYTLTQNALADFVTAHKRQCSGSGDDKVLELLQSVPAREDLFLRLKEQFDTEIVLEASARAKQRVEPQTWDAFLSMAHEGLTGEEVADRHGMNVATVFKAKSRVLRFIREEVKRLLTDE